MGKMTLKGAKRPTVSQTLVDTQDLIDVSVTERGQFRDCRRRWFLETIDNLCPVGPSETALEFGTGIHAALEAYYLGGQTLDAMMEGWNEWLDATREQADSEAWEELLDLAELGEIMLHNYVQFDQLSPVQLGTVLNVEGIQPEGAPDLPNLPPYGPGTEVTRHESGRFQVPIVDPHTKLPLERNGKTPCLTGRLDLIVERATPKKGLWIVDHKTAASAHDDRGLDFDDQVTAYCYIMWRLTGVVPRGVVFNDLLKTAPDDPRILKDGSLSTAKDQNTTPDLYKEEMIEHGLMSPSGRILSEKHGACYDALLARGWDKYFRRFEPVRGLHELMSFEVRLHAEYLDMVDCREDITKIYPNPSNRKCQYCPVSPICLGMEQGSDVEGIIETRFRQKADRKAPRVV